MQRADVRLHPGLPSRLGAQAPDRTPSAGGRARRLPLHLPTIQKRQLSNGLPVWLVELHEVPVVQVNLVVLRGSADDPTGKFGIASLDGGDAPGGRRHAPSLEMADAIDFLGADLATTGATTRPMSGCTCPLPASPMTMPRRMLVSGC